MKRLLFTLTILITCLYTDAQQSEADELPMNDISSCPEGHGPGSMMARMIQGLGFRYHWATDSLTQADLDYRPSEEARSSFETLEHIYDLSVTITDFAQSRASKRPVVGRPAAYPDLREQTLSNLSTAVEVLRGLSEEEVAKMTMSFIRDGEQTDYPMYNAINGPIVDAITHVGQVVSFRRTSGNPIRKGVNVFLGTVN